MRRFHFELEKVLELRAWAEKEAELEMAKAMGEVNALELRLEEIAREKIAVAKSRFSGNVAEIRAIENYLLRLDRTKEALLEALAKATLILEQKREVFLAAQRERKVIDKLKEKKIAEYKKELQKDEIKTLDDLSGGTAARKNLLE